MNIGDMEMISDNSKKQKHRAAVRARLNDALSPTALKRLDAVTAATQLYGQGFNVFPQPFASKNGYPWAKLQYTRLHPDDLRELFFYHCNIAVMMGRTSQNLFIIDCETAEEFDRQGAYLEARNIKAWAVRSGGERRGGHYWLRCADGEVANIKIGVISPTVEIRGTRIYCLVPPSVHPETGERYIWESQESDFPPTVRLSQLDWLPLKLTRSKIGRGYTQAALDDELRILANTEQGARNIQLNDSAFALGQLVGAGALKYNEVAKALTHVATEIGLTAKEISLTIESGLQAGISTPREKVQKGNSRIAQTAAITWIQKQKWSGKTGPTRRAIAVALAERSITANPSGTFRASLRELAGLARVSVLTVRKSLTELVALDFVKQAGYDRLSGAALWAFTDTVWKLHTIQLEGSSVLIPPPLPDASERGALGKTAYLVYQELLRIGDPIMPKALADKIGITRAQVKTALRTLREKPANAGITLIERWPNGWVAVPVDDTWLDSLIAANCGTLGKGEARKQQFVEERQRAAAEPIRRAIFRQRTRTAVGN